MEVHTDSRARPASRARWCSSSSAPRSTCRPGRAAAPDGIAGAYAERYGADPAPLRAAGRARRRPASATPTSPATTTRPTASRPRRPSRQPVKVDNDLYVRDYARCILCYKCVEACGVDAQNTFAIAVAGRGFDARISTEWNVAAARLGLRLLRQLHRRLPDRRADVPVASTTCARPAPGTSRPRRVTDTICPYCGVGCTLTLHVQDNEIVKVTSPLDSSVTDGHLCIKGRFGFQFVQNRGPR